MKVIEKGTGQKGWAQNHVCSGMGNGMGGCGAKLLVEQGDLFKTGGDEDSLITFECVECGVLTNLREFPEHLKRPLLRHQEWKRHMLEFQ